MSRNRRFVVAEPDNDKGQTRFIFVMSIILLAAPFWGKAVAALILGVPLSAVVWW